MKRTAFCISALLATFATGAMAQEDMGGTGTGTDAVTGSGTQIGSPSEESRDRTGISTGSNRDDGTFEVYDTNRDGSIDETEARDGGLSRDYDVMDENRDRSVSRDEFDVWQQGRYYP